MDWPFAAVAVAGCLMLAALSFSPSEKIDPANVQAVSQSCIAKGMVAYVSKTPGQTVIECRQPEGAKK